MARMYQGLRLYPNDVCLCVNKRADARAAARLLALSAMHDNEWAYELMEQRYCEE